MDTGYGTTAYHPKVASLAARLDALYIHGHARFLLGHPALCLPPASDARARPDGVLLALPPVFGLR
eukprot:4354517-Lingulodinium_polyedra.AAC.1